MKPNPTKLDVNTMAGELERHYGEYTREPASKNTPTYSPVKLWGAIIVAIVAIYFIFNPMVGYHRVWSCQSHYYGIYVLLPDEDLGYNLEEARTLAGDRTIEDRPDCSYQDLPDSANN